MCDAQKVSQCLKGHHQHMAPPVTADVFTALCEGTTKEGTTVQERKKRKMSGVCLKKETIEKILPRSHSHNAI